MTGSRRNILLPEMHTCKERKKTLTGKAFLYFAIQREVLDRVERLRCVMGRSHTSEVQGSIESLKDIVKEALLSCDDFAGLLSMLSLLYVNLWKKRKGLLAAQISSALDQSNLGGQAKSR